MNRIQVARVGRAALVAVLITFGLLVTASGTEPLSAQQMFVEDGQNIQGPNVTVVHTTATLFTQIGPSRWQALNRADRSTRELQETERDEWSVYLVDPNGKKYQFDLYRRMVSVTPPNLAKTDLGVITAASKKPLKHAASPATPPAATTGVEAPTQQDSTKITATHAGTDVPNFEGVYRIYATHSDKCLLLDYGTGSIRQTGCYNTVGQYWKPVASSEGTFKLSAQLPSGGLGPDTAPFDFCAYYRGSENGSDLFASECSAYENGHSWTFVPVGDGIYRIKTAAGKCLDVEGASKADGAKLQQWACVPGKHQEFRLARAQPQAIPPAPTSPANTIARFAGYACTGGQGYRIQKTTDGTWQQLDADERAIKTLVPLIESDELLQLFDASRLTQHNLNFSERSVRVMNLKTRRTNTVCNDLAGTTTAPSPSQPLVGSTPRLPSLASAVQRTLASTTPSVSYIDLPHTTLLATSVSGLAKDHVNGMAVIGNKYILNYPSVQSSYGNLLVYDGDDLQRHVIELDGPGWPSGMQADGNWVAVGMPTHDGSYKRIKVYDIAPSGRILRSTLNVYEGQNAEFVGFAQLPGLEYLLLTPNNAYTAKSDLDSRNMGVEDYLKDIAFTQKKLEFERYRIEGLQNGLKQGEAGLAILTTDERPKEILVLSLGTDLEQSSFQYELYSLTRKSDGHFRAASLHSGKLEPPSNHGGSAASFRWGGTARINGGKLEIFAAPKRIDAAGYASDLVKWTWTLPSLE